MAEIIENQAAYVLHRRPFKENSLILDVFTLNFGRLSLVANGANKVSRKGAVKAGALQSFQPLILSWSGRGNLKTLRQSETSLPPYRLSSSSLYSAYYLNELLLQLTPEEDAVPNIFLNYSQSIEALVRGAKLEQTLRAFEYQLLSELGFMPSFEHDVLGETINTQAHYYLDPEDGFHPVSQPATVSGQESAAVFSGLMIQSIAKTEFYQDAGIDDKLLRDSKKLMRQLIDRALQGRPLKSRELYRQMIKPVTQEHN